MSILKRLAAKRNGDVAKVVYVIGDSEMSLDDAPGIVRFALKGLGKKFQKKFDHLVHPETGERPRIHLVVPNPEKPEVQCRLVTDSEEMRAWLKTKGIDIGEVVKDAA